MTRSSDLLLAMSVISKRLLLVIIAVVVVDLPRQLTALRLVHNKDPVQIVDTKTEGKLKQIYYKVVIGTEPTRESARLESARRLGVCNYGSIIFCNYFQAHWRQKN